MKKQHKLLLLFFILTSFFKSYSQEYEVNLSPEGKLETVYDNRGNVLKLKDILIDAPKEFGYLKTTSVTCSTTSYFNLYFEPGCGMEDTTNSTHNARRAVICKVFEDISNFITSPLSTTGNKVNIWVRNIANMNATTGTLGLASSFYIPYANSTNTIGGILDGEIWKTIHAGVDSYTNISSGTNTFYHGEVSFNFAPSISWNTNLAINTPSNMYDLYTVMLHEIVHSLGFNSFINQNGTSIDPSPYYSRYDTFLRTYNNIPLITIGSCNMYDISFNSAVSPTVLRPGCTLPNNLSNGVLNTTICNQAIKYVGSSTVPVYTPTCFEQGSSLSHFEDMLYPTCASPYVNDSYFVLSNVNLIGTTKRYLKPEERNVLCDIGYNVKTTFGTSTTSNGYYNYGGTACAGISVAGVNDGINSSNGSYTFIGSIATTGATSTSVYISGLLANDTVTTTGFECLQDITAPATTSILNISGTNTTISTFTTTTPGLHILRYFPVNGIQRGNITYVYVYIASPPNLGGCSATPSTCDLVMNGNFEQYSSLPDNIKQVIRSCGWDWPLTNQYYEPSYYNSSVINGPFAYTDIPCNNFGFQDCKNNTGNGYADIFRTEHAGRRILLTKLKTPLQANTNYQLSFDVSLQDTKSNFASNVQAYLSTATSNITFNTATNFEMNTVPNLPMLFSSPTITNTNGWDTVSFNFTTTTGGEQFLYLGFLKNSVLVSNATTTLPSCPNSYNDTRSATLSSFERELGYYIDNVSIIPTNGAVFNLPTSICSTQNLNDLSIYLSGTTATGVFSGNGVTLAGGVYSFNASVAGIGITTIGYTFTNSSGCSTTLYDSITISSTSLNATAIDAINDDFSSMPINSVSGGITTSVYANDLYNGLPSGGATLPNVTFTLVSPLSITGATINSSGLISIPAGTLAGTYTLTYRLSVIGNCTNIDTASVIIKVTNNTTPQIVAGIRANNVVNLIGLQSSGKSIISGYFTTYNNISKPYVARLNTDLTLDQTFNFSGNQSAVDMVIQPDDKIIAATWSAGFGGSVSGITRLLPDGGVDTTFNSGGVGTAERAGYTNNTAYACALQTDGKILLGGNFYYYNGVQRLGIVRLNSNGTLDTTFVPTELNTYYTSMAQNIVVQPDGKILLLGWFNSTIPGATVKNIIRLNANGSLDNTFLAADSVYLNLTGGNGLNCPLIKMALQPDGMIIVVGAFTKYNGTTVNSMVRLTSTGQLDPTFNISSGVDRDIQEILLEPVTNKIIIGGTFTTFGATPVKKLIRLTTTGNLDNTFSIGTGTTDNIIVAAYPYAYNYVKSLKRQSDGKIIVGGKFLTFNGLSATNITRIYGDVGVQAKSTIVEYKSEPEIDTNPSYENITIFPNPSKGIYNIDLSYVKEQTTITVFNILGELVFKQLLTPQTQNQIDISNLANGYYIARINNEIINIQQKLIKN